MATISYPIVNHTIMRHLSKFGIDWPSIHWVSVKSRWVYRRRKRRHCEMIFVVFVLPISVVVEGARRAISSTHGKIVWAIVVSKMPRTVALNPCGAGGRSRRFSLCLLARFTTFDGQIDKSKITEFVCPSSTRPLPWLDLRHLNLTARQADCVKSQNSN